MARRLPVYFLIDTSESMAGAAMDAVAEGLAALVATMQSDPRCIETVYVSIITFGATAKVAVPLTPVGDLLVPALRLGTGTKLGSALELLLSRFKCEVRTRQNAEERADYCPICFLLSDGTPTDDWRGAAAKVRALHDTGRCLVAALACGNDADVDTLRSITPHVVRGSAEFSALSAFFRWATASVRAASVAMDGAAESLLAAVPKGLGSAACDIEVAGHHPAMFIITQCQRMRLPCVLKHRWNGTIFEATSSVAVDGIEMSKGSGVEVDSSKISILPCPRCANPLWARCSCGQHFCCAGDRGRFTCPWCELAADYQPTNFSFNSSAG